MSWLCTAAQILGVRQKGRFMKTVKAQIAMFRRLLEKRFGSQRLRELHLEDLCPRQMKDWWMPSSSRYAVGSIVARHPIVSVKMTVMPTASASSENSKN